MKVEIYKPIKPWIITRPYGVYDKLYEQFGFSQHNGIDVRIVDKVTIAKDPFDGMVYRTGYQPTGGGLFLSVLSKNEYEFPDGKKCRILVDFLHLHKFIVFSGQEVRVGDELAICDNTGAASTGPHSHSQWRRVYYNGSSLTDVDSNKANNSFDPTEWFTMFAEDFKLAREAAEKAKTIVEDVIPKTPVEQQKTALDSLKGLLEWLSNWLKGM